jgi:hypothetical protein
LGFFIFTPLDEKWVFDGSFDEFEASLKKKSLAARKKAASRRTNGRLGQKRR